MARRFFSLTFLVTTSTALSACSWFQEDDGFQAVAPPPAAAEAPQVTPAGQTPLAPGVAPAGGNAFGAGGYAAPGAAPAVPPAPPASTPMPNEQYVRHTIVSGDRLWNLARTYKTSVERIQAVNGLTTDKILLGQTLTIPTTSPPPGAQLVPAPASAGVAPNPATTTNQPAVPSALNPVVQPLPTVTTPPPAPREPIAIPRPVN